MKTRNKKVKKIVSKKVFKKLSANDKRKIVNIARKIK